MCFYLLLLPYSFSLLLPPPHTLNCSFCSEESGVAAQRPTCQCAACKSLAVLHGQLPLSPLSWEENERQLLGTFQDIQPGFRELLPTWCDQYGPVRLGHPPALPRGPILFSTYASCVTGLNFECEESSICKKCKPVLWFLKWERADLVFLQVEGRTFTWSGWKAGKNTEGALPPPRGYDSTYKIWSVPSADGSSSTCSGCSKRYSHHTVINNSSFAS